MELDYKRMIKVLQIVSQREIDDEVLNLIWMIKIGILGAIGSGKTFVSKQFGLPVFNADKEAKKHLKKHSVLQKKLVNVFGKNILTGTDLDFKKLADVSFENEKNQKKILYIYTMHSKRMLKKSDPHGCFS